jgi:hypothetical protein
MLGPMRSITVLALAATVAACGGGGGDDDGDDAPAELVGHVRIEETEFGGGLGFVSSIRARFEAADPRPDLVNDGTCRVYQYACLGQVGGCGRPPAFSAGTITITGLATPVTLEPDGETAEYAGPGGLPDELFADAASVTATAGGDTVAGFTLATTAVAPMVSPYADATLGLVPGQPFDLTWTAAAGGAQVQLHVNWADVCHAGAEWYVLDCDVPDTGAFTVPAAITGALPATGFGQCGAQLIRFRRAMVSEPGRAIELFVGNGDYFGYI